MIKCRRRPFSLLRRIHRAVTLSEATGVPVDEILDGARAPVLPRRALLAGAAVAGVVMPRRHARATASVPRVVIIGGGLAGLSCAVSLWNKRGIAATIYEWNTTPGGRVKTLRGYFSNGLAAELCGQFISSEHTLMRGLAARYGLQLANANAHLGNTNDTFWFAGERYTAASLAKDWQNFGWSLFNAEAAKAGTATYMHATPSARRWDAMSVAQWVEQYVPGGNASPFGALCVADTVGENGSSADAQSGLNIVYLLGIDTSRAGGVQPHNYPVLGGTDELYQVVGGNDQIIAGLVSELPTGALQLGYRLVALRGGGGDPITCVFDNAGITTEVTADHLVLTLPPTTLRQIDLSGITLSPLRRRIIAQAALGNNAKLFLQVAGRPWISDSYDGNLLTDLPIGGGWDTGNTQAGGHGAGAKGLWVGYPGGAAGAALGPEYGLAIGQQAVPAPPAMVANLLTQVEPIFPGMTAGWHAGPGLAFVSDPNLSAYLLGAYSNYLVGQYTTIAGAEGLPECNLHFAGEYTSYDYQGFMEGGVQSGLRAAREIT